jgi:hypothetical protein
MVVSRSKWSRNMFFFVCVYPILKQTCFFRIEKQILQFATQTFVLDQNKSRITFFVWRPDQWEVHPVIFKVLYPKNRNPDIPCQFSTCMCMCLYIWGASQSTTLAGSILIQILSGKQWDANPCQSPVSIPCLYPCQTLNLIQAAIFTGFISTNQPVDLVDLQ